MEGRGGKQDWQKENLSCNAGPPAALVNPIGHQNCSIMKQNGWTLNPQPPSAMKVGCSGNGMILNEEARAERNFSLEEYLDGISPCSP